MPDELRKTIRRLALLAAAVCLIFALWPRYRYVVIPAPQVASASTRPGFIKPFGMHDGHDFDLAFGIVGEPFLHFTDHAEYTLSDVKDASGNLVGQNSSFNSHYSDTVTWTSPSALLAFAGSALLVFAGLLRPRKVIAAA